MDATDTLTKIYTRAAFFKLLSKHAHEANLYKTKIALLIVDIDRFYRINNLFGYEVGDQILQKFAELLQNVTRKQDFVGRIGDNRFALIAKDIMNVGHADLAARKILRLLQNPFNIGTEKIYIDCTIGISLCPTHASNYLYLVKECESVLFEAKQDNQKIGISKIPDEDELSDAWDIELALGDALSNDELSVYYQPKISLDSDGVIGAEALLRWIHPTKGFIPPDYFIPIAERMGHIKPITNWIYNTVLRQSSEWTDKWGPLSVSVNIPPELILQPDFKDNVTNSIKLWSSDNITLVLEIIERSLVIDPERGFSVLRELQEMGIKISIDDFGTGYSCLSYFETLPVDELKIDQSFIRNIVANKSSQNIVRLIVDLAHAFDMEVVAEGVEEHPMIDYLKKFKCDIAQGYFFAKPMPHEEMKEWLVNVTKESLYKL